MKKDIVEIFEKKGFNVASILKLAGITAQTFNNLKHGKRSLKTSTRYRLYKAFNLTDDEIKYIEMKYFLGVE